MASLFGVKLLPINCELLFNWQIFKIYWLESTHNSKIPKNLYSHVRHIETFPICLQAALKMKTIDALIRFNFITHFFSMRTFKLRILCLQYFRSQDTHFPNEYDYYEALNTSDERHGNTLGATQYFIETTTTATTTNEMAKLRKLHKNRLMDRENGNHFLLIADKSIRFIRYRI